MCLVRDVGTSLSMLRLQAFNPKGPCTQIVYTLGPTYLHRDYFIRPKYMLVGYMDP